MALVEREGADLPLCTQADLLSLNRASLYYRPRPASAEEVALKHRIDALYTQYPFYGSRRITAHLRREGMSINCKAVQRHMREMGIAGICPGPNLTRRIRGEQVYSYLLRDLTCRYPNQVWGIDVTYILMQTSWMYLVAVLDWFSRYVVRWELDDTLQLPFVLRAVQRALAQARPEIWNSDQGVISRVRSTATFCWERMCGSVWMAKAGRWTISSSSGCGARSSMDKSISTTMPAHATHERV